MADERFAEHLQHPHALGLAPDGACTGTAGGAACGDLIQIRIATDGQTVTGVGFDASGCGAASAAASAAVTLADGASVLDAARIDAAAVSAELGGLSAGKFHAADLASDALAVALGAAIMRAPAANVLDEGRTLVALSGGVDSAVAATLEAQAGREVVCVTLELWRSAENDAERSCCSASAVRLARSVAHKAGMPHFTVDLRQEFRVGVVEPYLEGHRRGATPNPCIKCNGNVRIDAMVGLADRLGAATLVTGHYAQLEDGLLRAGVDPAKDQSYMLAGLDPATLARLRFPLGHLAKPQVRELAEAAQISVAKRPESQDLCFLAGTGKRAFLQRHGGLEDRPGPIVTASGEVVGAHHGAHNFTVGQRRGLDLGGGPIRYVIATDPAANTVTVGSAEDLLAHRVELSGVALHRGEEAVRAVRLRYHAKAIPCRLEGTTLHLEQPFPGVAPGQSACLLDGDVVVGTGTIVSAA
ncbi:MAG: tRNA 2-thiouridine(34) synthase MnmA [Solirubrobacteraceae bacterium]|nr:tRNA 2-thiouridine(34) synthase MnmA [Solirubrobacteraceae bacterium]